MGINIDDERMLLDKEDLLSNWVKDKIAKEDLLNVLKLLMSVNPKMGQRYVSAVSLAQEAIRKYDIETS